MKTLLNFIFLILLVIIFNVNISKSIFLGLTDEILLIISMFIIIYYAFNELLFSEISKIYFVLFLYFLYQFINYLFSPFELSLGLVLAQSIINLKVFLIALAGMLIYSNTPNNKKVVTVVLTLFVSLFVMGLIMNMLLGETWNQIFHEEVKYRYGFIRPIGYFMHFAPNAYFFVLTFITLLLLYGKKRVIKISSYIKKFFMFLIIDFAMAFPLTVRKGMIMNIPFGLFVLTLLDRRSRYIFALFTLIFISVFLFLIKDMQIMQDTLDNFSNFTHDEHTYIRGLMFFYGVTLCIEFFPFGAGNATFGTVLSKYNTFDVYEYVGLPLNSIYDEDNNKLMGVYDSGLASMLAENGFMGMVLIGLFIYYFFKFNKNRLDWYNYQIFKIITIFTLFMSITEPAWQNGLYSVFYVINLLFIYTKNDLYRENGKWVRYEN
ncbi:hypothetical protein [Sulfurovum sp. TSL1]|uniref:hypothetical protein n=1 Tax=Sulfurovum sp. TSL1 TaxID=2826994 RepID=UPI001CC4C91D|nr:hypothetical protein [Sulfurovum sp. TSL1]GIT98459.1 hypothetical protein TSL1_12800 [Sulfurovum sp. TSL1]